VEKQRIHFAHTADGVSMDAVNDFLSTSDHHAEQPAAPIQVAPGLQTILFTDMEGSTSLTQRLGDAAAQELVRTHNSIVREALRAHDGSEIKHTGDGIMATFPSAARALACAVAVQRAVAERNASLPAHPEPVEGRAEPQPSAHASTSSARADRSVGAEPFAVRIGLNAGEPVAEDDDLFGSAVQLAARICAQADAGDILVSNVVRELAVGKGFDFSDRGTTELKGFDDPVRLYRVAWQEE